MGIPERIRVKSCNPIFRGAWRGGDRELFDADWEVKVLVERWRQAYNRIRPHSALGYRPPAPEAVAPRGAQLTLFLVQPGGRSKAHERSGGQRLSTVLM